ncbi:MAG: hypothetical protein HYR84_07265 [Planctomycetes bacterium]|nr:hypothetical protein [Planctomycetota bacterium]
MSLTGHVQNGGGVFDTPNALPDGTAVKVEAIEVPSKAGKRSLLDRLGDIGLTEEEWRDDPESIAAWVAGVRSIERPEYTPQEREEMARYREEHCRYNLEAVRRQMEAGDER